MNAAAELFKQFRATVHHKGNEHYWFFDLEEVAKVFLRNYEDVLENIDDVKEELLNIFDTEERQRMLNLLSSYEQDKKQMEYIKVTYLDVLVCKHRGYIITHYVDEGCELFWYLGEVVFHSLDVEEAAQAADFMNAHAFITSEIKL